MVKYTTSDLQAFWCLTVIQYDKGKHKEQQSLSERQKGIEKMTYISRHKSFVQTLWAAYPPANIAERDNRSVLNCLNCHIAALCVGSEEARTFIAQDTASVMQTFIPTTVVVKLSFKSYNFRRTSSVLKLQVFCYISSSYQLLNQKFHGI